MVVWWLSRFHFALSDKRLCGWNVVYGVNNGYFCDVRRERYGSIEDLQ